MSGYLHEYNITDMSRCTKQDPRKTQRTRNETGAAYMTRNNRTMSECGLSRTVVPHLLQANSRLTPLRAHHKLLLVDPTFARVFIIIR